MSIRKYVMLCIPIILSQVGQVVVNLVDNVMVGQAGKEYLAAASFASSIFFLPLTFGMGILMSITPLVGKAHGESNKSRIVQILHNGLATNLMLMVALIIISVVIGLCFPYMGQTPEVVDLATEYYFILVASLIPLLAFMVLKQFAEGLLNTKMAMFITIGSNLLNIFLNYLFIYGKWGFPEMKLMGAGLATFISRFIMPFIMVWAFKKSKELSQYRLRFKLEEVKRNMVMRIVKTGLPIATQMLVEASVFTLAAIMVGWISSDALAAHQVAATLSFFTFMFVNGFAQGATIHISYLWGKGDYFLARRAIRVSYWMVAIVACFYGIVFVFTRYILPTLFVDDIEVIHIAANILLVVAVYQVFDALQVVGLGVSRAFADVKVPMILAVISYIFIGIPVGYILGFVFDLGVNGIWMGCATGLGMAAILFYIRVHHTVRRHMPQNRA